MGGVHKQQQLMIYRDLPTGFLIKVRYLGPTNHKGSRWAATYKRSSDQTFRAVTPCHGTSHDDNANGYAAALACLAKINADRLGILPGGREFVLSCAAHDNDAYYYVATYPEVAA